MKDPQPRSRGELLEQGLLVVPRRTLHRSAIAGSSRLGQAECVPSARAWRAGPQERRVAVSDPIRHRGEDRERNVGRGDGSRGRHGHWRRNTGNGGLADRVPPIDATVVWARRPT